MSNKKVLLIIAHEGFQPVEYGAPKNILEKAGVRVVTASDALGVAISSITEDQVKVDLIIDEVKVTDYDGVFFIGGSGASEYLENESIYRVAREVAELGRLYGAICYSTRILAHAGVLRNMKVTGWDGDNALGGILTVAGADYVREPVVADGKIITAVGPKAAAQWGEEILKLLKL